MTTSWLVRVQPVAQPTMRLLCVPYAGVGASAYRLWRGALSPDIEVLALQAPGRESRLRETPFTEMQSLVTAATEAVRDELDVPFAIFGHSVGALIAFELVRHLRDEGCSEPVHLFVSGRRPPHLPPRHPAIAQLPDHEFVAEIDRRYGGIPAEVMSEPDLLALLLPGLKADIALFEGYRYRPLAPLACPISAYGGSQDADAVPADLGRWQQLTRGAFTVRTFPGAHFFLQTAHADVVRAVGDALAHTLVGEGMS
jgi:medium-chain acyl-[acyl-carrier-protein] hydrolase